jgi:hypothetical protein
MGARAVAERVSDVRGLLRAARDVHRRRADLAPAIAASTGLSLPGVELGFGCLEIEADDASLERLVASVAEASRVHVVLSANVFVAPLRALALARAASDRVTVRPSPRDPTLARALVAAAANPALALLEERDIAGIEEGDIHVYGRDASVAAVRARARPGVIVRGHGAGMGVAVVTRDAVVPSAASDLARDVVVFDQRGCLSPRLAIVEGDGRRASAFAEALHLELAAWEARAPRGALSEDERVQAAAWREGLRFAGQVWSGAAHMVALAPGSALAVPPPGRHVCVVAAGSLEDVRDSLAPVAALVVAVGSDAPARVQEVAPEHARLSALGEMQHPRLDGPLDRRDQRKIIPATDLFRE